MADKNVLYSMVPRTHFQTEFQSPCSLTFVIRHRHTPIWTPDLATELSHDPGSFTSGALLSCPITHFNDHIEEIWRDRNEEKDQTKKLMCWSCGKKCKKRERWVIKVLNWSLDLPQGLVNTASTGF